MSVQDARTAPFVWASVAALRHLREHWNEGPTEAGAREHVGRSVYYALCELANEDRARTALHEDSGKFRTSRKRICEQAGVSDKPVDKALRELERIGLLRVERAETNGSRPGAISFYTLLEPEETCGASPHVEDVEGAEEVRTSSGVGPQVDSERAEEVRTSPYREKKNSKEEKVCVPTADPPQLPRAVEEPLRQVAEGKEAVFDPAAVRRACEAYADRDHALEAEKFAGWNLHGNGRNAPLSQIAPAFRKWLKRSPAVKSDGRRATALPPAAPSSPVVESEQATAAWVAAKGLLADQLPCSTFNIYMAPIEVAGERAGRLVLVDTSDQGVGAHVLRRYRALILEMLDGFEDIELVDEKQLELEAA